MILQGTLMIDIFQKYKKFKFIKTLPLIFLKQILQLNLRNKIFSLQSHLKSSNFFPKKSLQKHRQEIQIYTYWSRPRWNQTSY